MAHRRIAQADRCRISRLSIIGARELGTRACQRGTTGRPRCHAVDAQPGRATAIARTRAESRGCPAHGSTIASRSRQTSKRPRAAMRSCWSSRRRRCARSRPQLAPLITQRHAGHRLRQGHRTRHAQIHDRGHRGCCAECRARHPVRSELCGRCDRAACRPRSRSPRPTRKSPRALSQALGSATFRPYHSTDLRGVEIGGAAKNVLAIAAGIVSGRGLGDSAAAALTTRGFAEIMRFGRACGAQPETLIGLSGPRRPDPDLLVAAIAQLFARARARPRAVAARGARQRRSLPKASLPRRC